MLLSLAAACVPHRPYWLEPEPGVAWKNTSKQLEVNEKGKQLAEGTKEEPPLCIVEFDDHGEFWSLQQDKAVDRMLEKKGGKPPLVILFAHGWKNNADEKCGDLLSFQKLLRKLQQEKVLTQQFNVFGIYVGWRGDVTPKAVEYTGVGFVARQLTIYNRMDAADRLANGLPFTRFLGRVAQLSMQKQEINGKEVQGKCVMIGHSLGARILENTITRSLVENYGTASEGGSNGRGIELKKPADLVLLINPASDALRMRQTLMSVQWNALSAQRRINDDGSLGDRYHVPLIVSLRSETDTATGWVYTLAMKIGKWSRKTRMYPVEKRGGDDQKGNIAEVDHDQKKYITHTPSTLPHLLSHQVVENPVGPTEAAFNPLDYNLKWATLNRFLLTDSNQQKKWYVIEPDKQTKLKVYNPQAEDLKRGSCWVMKVPPAVLKGHGGEKKLNGIFSPSMIDLFAALYRISKPASPEQARHARPKQADKKGESYVPYMLKMDIPYLATPMQMAQPLREVIQEEVAIPPVPKAPPAGP